MEELLMIRRVAVAALYVIGTLAMAVVYWMTTDHSPRATYDWVLLHQFGVVIPGIWSFRTHRTLQKANLPMTFEWRLVAWGPAVMAAIVTLHAVRMLEP
jgi:hypothetical protein